MNGPHKATTCFPIPSLFFTLLLLFWWPEVTTLSWQCPLYVRRWAESGTFCVAPRNRAVYNTVPHSKLLTSSPTRQVLNYETYPWIPHVVSVNKALLKHRYVSMFYILSVPWHTAKLELFTIWPSTVYYTLNKSKEEDPLQHTKSSLVHPAIHPRKIKYQLYGPWSRYFQ